MHPIRPDETELVGEWILRNGKVEGDETARRINWLIEHSLERIAHHPEFGAWETLFRDNADGRYWERIYPQSELHGGGPPALRVLDHATARLKYAPQS